ncbi:MAG: glycosyltransferase family 2 protein, partial [Deinococcus sp.]|nr:glycosyltransferase family 2 protein [Deinococcus sp.]
SGQRALRCSLLASVPDLMLDADLVGLRPDHLVRLSDPVLQGEVDMAVGQFVGGRWRTDWAQWITPNLSGQRALRCSLLASVPDLVARRYDLELALTHHAKQQGARVCYVRLAGLTQVMKEEKRGFWVGFTQRLLMYWQILRYALKR